MGDGSLHHVAEVVQLVTVLDLGPTLLAGPPVGALRVARPGCIEVAVRLLGSSDYHQDTVYVRVQARVGISLHEIRSSLDGLVHVRIIERQSSDDETEILLRMELLCRLFEVAVSASLLAFTECERYRDLAGSLESLAPEGVRNLHRRERNGTERIVVGLLVLARQCQEHGQ